MLKLIATLLFMVTTATAVDAVACSITPQPPSEKFAESQAVVIALPKTISNRPKEGASPAFSGSFRQTILWQVLLVWKGEYKPGDEFTTRQVIDKSGPCSALLGHYGEDARLMYLFGRAPYSKFYDLPLSYSAEDLQYLQKRVKLSRAGT